MLHRSAAVAPSTLNPEARTVEVTLEPGTTKNDAMWQSIARGLKHNFFNDMLGDDRRPKLDAVDHEPSGVAGPRSSAASPS